MRNRDNIDYGKEYPCRGKDCGKNVIFIDVVVKGELRRVCLDASPIFMYVPYFQKTDERTSGQKRPMKWIRRVCFRSHRDLCANAAEFDKRVLS